MEPFDDSSSAGLKTAKNFMEKLKCNPRVRIRNPDEIAEKLCKMAKQGLSGLMVLSDFDMTLTRHTKNGVKCINMHHVLADVEAERDPEKYKMLMAECDSFKAIEHCAEMSVAEKVPYMEEWWTLEQEYIIKQKFTKHFMSERIHKNSRIAIRENCAELFALLNKQGIPMVVLSAAIGTFVEMVLQQQIVEELRSKNGMTAESFFDGVHIVSNMMEFDERDVCVGFSRPLIHTFNKNSEALVARDAPFMAKLAGRKAVLLLGDSLGDVHMNIGVGPESVVLKVGFLNFNVETLLNRYMDEYDIVLVDEPSMDVPIRILRHILMANNYIFSRYQDCESSLLCL